MADNTILIGVDDTDNLTSRGTGYRARCLAEELEQAGLAQVKGVTRHQLLVDDAVPYTSHNSSACIAVDSRTETDELVRFCRGFLLEIAAAGSDVGLCVSPRGKAVALASFGRDAQRAVLKRKDAEAAAQRQGVYLQGLTGDHQGIIGAIAAVGLHASGNDGRYIWVRAIRDLTDQTLTLETLLRETGVEVVMDLNESRVTDPASSVALGRWPRPVPVNGRAVLLVEKNNGGNANWKVVAKEVIKAYRP